MDECFRLSCTCLTVVVVLNIHSDSFKFQVFTSMEFNPIAASWSEAHGESIKCIWKFKSQNFNFCFAEYHISKCTQCLTLSLSPLWDLILQISTLKIILLKFKTFEYSKCNHMPYLQGNLPTRNLLPGNNMFVLTTRGRLEIPCVDVR